MGYIIVLTKQAQKDAKKLDFCNLDKKAKELIFKSLKPSFMAP